MNQNKYHGYHYYVCTLREIYNGYDNKSYCVFKEGERKCIFNSGAKRNNGNIDEMIFVFYSCSGGNSLKFANCLVLYSILSEIFY